MEKNAGQPSAHLAGSAREEVCQLAELNAWLGERCRALWADTAHPQHPHSSVAEVLTLEREHLMGMPTPFDGYVERLARVTSTCLVVVGPQPVFGAVRMGGRR